MRKFALSPNCFGKKKMNPSEDFWGFFNLPYFQDILRKTLKFFLPKNSSMPKYLFRQHFNPTNITNL